MERFPDNRRRDGSLVGSRLRAWRIGKESGARAGGLCRHYRAARTPVRVRSSPPEAVRRQDPKGAGVGDANRISCNDPMSRTIGNIRRVAGSIAGRTTAGQYARSRVAAVAVAARSVEAFDRPAWLYRSGGAIPRLELQFRAPCAVASADIALCQRLIDAHTLAQEDAPRTAGLWSHNVFQHRQRELSDALAKRDPEVLARLLSAMFRSEFVLGMAFGSLGVGSSSALRQRFWRMSILSRFVALAESQGACRVEDIIQGGVGLAFVNGVDKLAHDTEAALGVSVDFPDVGAAYGIDVADRLITFDSPDQIYAAARLRDAIRVHLPDRELPLRVVEIGGGYGGMTYWLMMMGIVTDYVVVDLPVVNVLQGYFLAQSLGPSQVSFHGEAKRNVSIVPAQALSTITSPFPILVNKDSMPEIDRRTVEGYLAWARESCDGLFYSYNQEAAAATEDSAQNVVPEIIRQVGGFERVRRDLSWLRGGYTEEIYLPVGGP